MAGEATTTTIAAILKSLYHKGTPPNALSKDMPLLAATTKEEDFAGDNFRLPIVYDATGGGSATFATAQTNIYPTQMTKFTVTRAKDYSVAQMDGEAIDASNMDIGAITNGLKLEMDSTFHTSLRSLALAEYGNGTGVRGISNGDSLVSTTVTLTVAMDATKFSVGMVVDLVAASGGTGLSPTLRTATGTPRITGVNASAGTLTFASNFSTYFSDEVAGDYLLRAGDAASAGTASVFTGLGAWVEGGSSPAALFGVTRTVDPIKLAGHAIDCSTLGVEDSFAQATTQIAVYGGSPTHCYVHPIKYGVMLKTATSRIQYQRSQFKAAGLLFSSLEVEGVNGPIKVVPDMNCDYGTAFMVDQSKIKMKTAGKCPKIFDLDTLQKQRVYNADKYEWRIGGYGNFYVERPSSHARLTSFGATT